DHTYMRYGTNVPANNGNANYLIDTDDAISTGSVSGGMVLDHVMAQANVYYQNNYIKSIYMRTASGAPGYPVSPWTGGYYAYGSSWGNLPGVFFMFGQMEGKVSPYSATSPSPMPTPTPTPSGNILGYSTLGSMTDTYDSYNMAASRFTMPNTGGTAAS